MTIVDTIVATSAAKPRPFETASNALPHVGLCPRRPAASAAGRLTATRLETHAEPRHPPANAKQGLKIAGAASLCLSLTTLACTSALWLERHDQPGVVLPPRIPIVVRVSDRVAQLDEEGSVAALVDELEDQLVAKGLTFRIIASDGDPVPKAHVDLFIQAHDENAPNKTPLKVECTIFDAEEHRVFTGVMGTPFSPRRAKTSGRALAEVIVSHAPH